jgi:hypothetical protein
MKGLLIFRASSARTTEKNPPDERMPAVKRQCETHLCAVQRR